MSKRVGKSLYVFLCSILGMALFVILHRSLFVLYQVFISFDAGNAFVVSDEALQAIDFFTMLLALFFGGWYGTMLGLHWYKMVYGPEGANPIFHRFLPASLRGPRTGSGSGFGGGFNFGFGSSAKSSSGSGSGAKSVKKTLVKLARPKTLSATKKSSSLKSSFSPFFSSEFLMGAPMQVPGSAANTKRTASKRVVSAKRPSTVRSRSTAKKAPSKVAAL